MTLFSFLSFWQDRLAAAGIENPALDVRLLAAAALRTDRAGLLIQSRREMAAQEIAACESLLARRAAREPVARLLGLREFWGLPFALNEATLEPRPDSETLIETALALHPQARRLLDLGTGTGCLLLALLHDLPQGTGLGIDSAPRAVAQAQENAHRLDLGARASFRLGNWLEGIEARFDLILSNPPYIPSREIETLAPEVRLFDPRAALDGGEDGLTPYRLMIPQLPDFLEPNGLVLFEVGAGQALDVAQLLTEIGFESVTIRKDLGGIERCVGGFWRR